MPTITTQVQPGRPSILAATAPTSDDGSTTTLTFKPLSITLTLSEAHGHVVLSATTSGPVPNACFAAVYPNEPTGNPNSGYYPGAWFWLGGSQTSMETDLPWGTGYYAAVAYQIDATNDVYACAGTIGPT